MLATTLSLVSVFAMDSSEDDLYKIPRILHKKIRKVPLVNIDKNLGTLLNHPGCKHCKTLKPEKESAKNLGLNKIPHGKTLKPRGHVFCEDPIYSSIDFQVSGSENDCFIGFYDKKQEINFLGKVHSLDREEVREFIKSNHNNIFVYLLSTKYGGNDLSKAIQFFLKEVNLSPSQLEVLRFEESSRYMIMRNGTLDQLPDNPLSEIEPFPYSSLK